MISVHSILTENKILDEKVYTKIQKSPYKLDIVTIFVGVFLLDIVKNFVASEVGVFWSQLGIENDEAFDFL